MRTDPADNRMWLEAREVAAHKGMPTPMYIRKCGPLPECRGRFRSCDDALAAYTSWKQEFFGYGQNRDKLLPKRRIRPEYKEQRNYAMLDLETTQSLMHSLGKSATVLGMFADITYQGTAPVNKTIAELQAELDAAVIAKAEVDAAAERKAKLDNHIDLCAATNVLLLAIRNRSVSPNALLARFRKELQALAGEYGVRIVPVGDRSTAVLVQQ